MGTAELTAKIESLSEEDYNMVIMLVNRLSEKSEIGGLQKMSEDEIVEQLSESMADSFGYCNSDRLKELGLHKIHFSKHRYMFVYRVDKSKVIIEGMYHEMQDYENSIL